MMFLDNPKHLVGQHDINFSLHGRLRYTITVKQMDAAKIFLLTTSDVLRHTTPFFAAFVWYTVQHLLHEGLYSVHLENAKFRFL